jgi:transcriptional regulator with XRE-family HTH domain
VARPYAEDFGRAIRLAYTGAGLTQAELAEGLREAGWVNVDQSLVSKWVRGLAVPPLDALPVIDAACRQPKGYVLELAGFVDVQGLANRERPDPFSRLAEQRGGASPRRRPHAV